MFVIIAEGTVTEQEYFRLLDDDSVVRVKCLENKTNLPPDRALQRVKEHVSREGGRKGDQAWVVIDKDSWPEEHLQALHLWAQSKPAYGFALSNPKFEYWLLLHFAIPRASQPGRNVKPVLRRSFRKNMTSTSIPAILTCKRFRRPSPEQRLGILRPVRIGRGNPGPPYTGLWKPYLRRVDKHPSPALQSISFEPRSLRW
jgi:hypothetical protein